MTNDQKLELGTKGNPPPTSQRLRSVVMLPTPSVRDYKGPNDIENTKKKIAKGEGAHMGQLPNYIAVATGKTSQLNPRFVAEMMGFPVDWTELPFLNGDQKA